MTLARLLEDVQTHLDQRGLSDGVFGCNVRNTAATRISRQRSATCSVVDPVICLVLQGQKSVQFGTHRCTYQPGDVIVIGQSLPMVSGAIDATPEHPYLALYITLDMQVMRSVYSDLGGRLNSDSGSALGIGQAEDDLIDAVSRLFRLHRDPVEERALGMAALREVYFRVLRSKHSAALHQIIHADSKANQIAKAIAHIRKEYRNTIKAADLAALAGMSASVFYENFKQITANSPLQFQKDLRLLEAHSLLQSAQAPVSEIAFAVGYESAAQFSREFSRKFGSSPKSVMDAVAA